mmetsp:Transcript_33395/g.34024  ORF Transcript_33395/g.34024 Transcript_33395/m.34024 type:complete len:251 (+) Transcript_33395:124-876(+)
MTLCNCFLILAFSQFLQFTVSFHLNSISIRYRSDTSLYFDENNDFEKEFDDRVERRLNEKFRPQRKNKKRSSKPQLFKDLNKWEVVNRAVIAGVFVAGIGTGITLDSAINTNPKDLASRDAIDRNAPNPKICSAYGSSAMVLDERLFITFNPFNIYVTQADTKPGCVLRPSNVVSQLQKERPLLTDEEIEGCKNGYNTWAYVGDINNKPQLTCVFQSDDAQNEFLSNPTVGLGEDVYDSYKKLDETMKKD